MDRWQFYWDLVQVLNCMFLPMITNDFDRFSAHGDKVTDGLPDGSTDKSDDVQMERNFLGF